MSAPRIPNNVADWMANFRGYVKPYLYEVTFSGKGFQTALDNAVPSGMIGPSAKDMTYLCEAASLPGSAVSTQPNRIHGPVRELAYERLFSGDLSLTFRMDAYMTMRKFFQAWHNGISDSETGDFNYYRDYTSDILIYQYPTTQSDGFGDPNSHGGAYPIYGVRVVEAYPKSLQAIEVGYEQRDTYMKQTVDFAFRRWEQIPQNELYSGGGGS